MFFDGITFASIARNLAEGRGRFWEPSYTATIYPAFYEHPPLGFWLQSLWFRALGDHWLSNGCLASPPVCHRTPDHLHLALLRTSDAADGPARDYEWLPVAFWIAVPVVSDHRRQPPRNDRRRFVAAVAAAVASTRHSVGLRLPGSGVGSVVGAFW